MASILKVDQIEPKTGGGNITIATQDRVMFSGGLASDQAGTRVTEVQVTGMTSNEIDTHSAFNGTNFTVPSGKAGKYYIAFNCGVNYDDIGDDGEVTYIATKVNGTCKMTTSIAHNSTGHMKYVTPFHTVLLDLSVGDVVTWWLYGHATSGDHTIMNGSGSYPYTMVHGYQLA
tara:strand:+ start:443 stop:961 length:519 start_codon:yes stop_codon:yes gene_type:complete